MGIRKYKYYFRKPKSEIVKDVLIWLLTAGTVYIAASSPYFIRNLLKNYRKWRKYSSKKIYNTFYLLQKQGCIRIENKGHQIYISLTEKGRKKAGIFQINDLKINKPKEWDRKWRLIIFDISELKRIYRESFRGKLKDLGFTPLQKSVWIYPFDCSAEIELLRDFFGLTENEIRLVVSDNIGDDSKLKNFFKLN